MGLAQVHLKYVDRQETPLRRYSVLFFTAQVHFPPSRPPSCFIIRILKALSKQGESFWLPSSLEYTWLGGEGGDEHVGAIWCQEQDIAGGRSELERGRGIMTEHWEEGPPW